MNSSTTPSDSEKLEPVAWRGRISEDSSIWEYRGFDMKGYVWDVVQPLYTRAPDSDRQQGGVEASLREETERMVTFAQALCDAADHYGVKHLDSDDMDDEAVNLQAATIAMRHVLADCLAALTTQPVPVDASAAKGEGAAWRAHQLTKALLEVRESIETYPLDDTATCMCGSPVDGHNVGSGHAPVSQADHAISLIVETINKALAIVANPADALMGAGRPDDYEGPDVGMHDTEIVDDESDNPNANEGAAK